MRISGGLAKGIPLEIPKGVDLRPATEANRERLFSSLGEKVLETSFLDLCAGTGSYGLEAISRGAKDGVFVENNRKAVMCLKNNLLNVRKSAQLNNEVGTIKNREVTEYLKSEIEQFNLIFLDPPYPLFSKIGSPIFRIIRDQKILANSGLLIHEAPPEEKIEFPGWSLIRTIGKSKKGSPQFRLFRLGD
jgi:16S rRNA (guanine966-N2)-methyltransferase